MDQFSHDLTVALEETSLLNRARVSWGQRRRTRSTGNLPSAPQPTEDSSSSPTDTAPRPVNTNAVAANVDNLDTHNSALPLSDSDEKEELVLRFPAAAIHRLATLESDSLNETFSPARFFKPSTRRKRKLKRMAVEYEDTNATNATNYFMESNCSTAGSNLATGTIRKRGLKTDVSHNAHRSNNLFFCGKRKRSNRDRYHDNTEHGGIGGSSNSRFGLHSCSMPRYNHWDEYRGMRPRSFSSTSKPHSDRLLPLNKGLVSKIERIAQLQKTANNQPQQQLQLQPQQQRHSQEQANIGVLAVPSGTAAIAEAVEIAQVVTIRGNKTLSPILCVQKSQQNKQQQQIEEQQSQQTEPLASSTSVAGIFQGRRKKQHHPQRASRRRSQLQQQLQFAVDQYSMDCGELNDFLSSSSLSSSETDDAQTANGTDREGDDELTDWPGNEFGNGPATDLKRKLTKKSQMAQIRSDDMDGDTMVSGVDWSSAMLDADAQDSLEMRYQPTEPITIAHRGFGLGGGSLGSNVGSGSGSHAGLSEAGFSGPCNCEVLSSQERDESIPVKQIESEMSGETSNNFLSSPPSQMAGVREIRAGCRRVKSERPGFSIKTSVNERLARFLQDPRLMQIRLPDIEIYEHDSLLNLSTLYSLQMTLENGCVVLTKTR